MQNLEKPINRLLAALPNDVYQRLYPHLELVELPQHKVLYHAGENYEYAYFPSRAIISIIAIMENGSTTEIAVVGNEGMVGLPIILDTDYTNFTAIVQVGNGGYRIKAKRLQEELNCNGALKRLLMRYIQARMVQLGQIAACNRYHNLEQRFARWMLLIKDNIQKDEFQLTQEFISQMLGVRRTGVTQVAVKFKKAGIIDYKRGLVRIICKESLESAACECYELIAKEHSRLLDNFK